MSEKDAFAYHTAYSGADAGRQHIHVSGHATQEQAEGFIGSPADYYGNLPRWVPSDAVWTHVVKVERLDPPKKVEGFLVSYVTDEGMVYTFGDCCAPGDPPYKTREAAERRITLLASAYQRTAKVIDLSA